MTCGVRIKNKGPGNLIVRVKSTDKRYPSMYLRPGEEARPYATKWTKIEIVEDDLDGSSTRATCKG